MIHYSTIEEKVVALVREYHLSNQIVFSSFNHDSVSLLAEIAPEIPRAILYDTPLADPIAEAKTRSNWITPKLSIINERVCPISTGTRICFPPLHN